MKLKDYIILFLIVVIGFLFRTYNINWDSGYHMHPDERAIVMFTTPLQFPTSIAAFFSPQSTWNPHFFAYGSFPIYFLKIMSLIVGLIDPTYMTYDKINLLGRFFSALFDSATICLLFLLGKKLFSKTTGFFAAVLYAVTVLAIQLSHFYAVDTLLTFFITLTLYGLIKLYEQSTLKRALFVGIIFGFALATKTSAIALGSAIFITLFADFILIFLKQPHKPHIWFPHIPKIIRILFTDGLIIGITGAITFSILEPYALIDFQNFWLQNMQQAAMTKSAFTFPYTLQYVGKIPYWYEFKNIFLWGEGPVLALFSFIGIIYFIYLAITKEKHTKWAQETILAVFFVSYTLVVGKFAIGFMRYMLPVYPLLSLFAAVLIYKLISMIKKSIGHWYILVVLIIIGSIIIWPLSFMAIYQQINTRIAASNWINTVIPSGKTLAIEHWDDALPIVGQEKYHMLTLKLYDPDTSEKWNEVNQQLSQTDYIIIASNRLYVPLQKLTDCANLDPYHCYTQTALYYHNLFNGTLGFQKVAEFAVYPTIPILNIPINDQGADESFTVYDHPKVMIFQKNP